MLGPQPLGGRVDDLDLLPPDVAALPRMRVEARERDPRRGDPEVPPEGVIDHPHRAHEPIDA